MRHLFIPLILAATVAFPALAETPLTGAEFDAATVNSTITYEFGTE
jgi:hypothetical protein